MKRIFAGALAALLSIGACAATLLPVQLLNPTGSTSGQTIVSTGAGAAPGWSTVPLSGLAPQAANTVIGNSTNLSASPTAITVTGCNGAAQALQWTNGSGFGCNSAVATSGANANITSLTGLTGGIVGTTTNNNASAGSVGEYICAQVTNGGSPTGCATNSSTPVSLTTNVAANITSITLAAGDWDVGGVVEIFGTGTTVITNAFGSVSSTSATLGALGQYWHVAPGGTPSGSDWGLAVPTSRFSVASTTTVYLVGFCGFSASTCSATGRIWARRPR